MPSLLFRGIVFSLGLGLVVATLFSALRTLVLPRAAQDALTRFVFVAVRNLFGLRLKRLKTYEQVDHLMALYAPFALLALVPAWLSFVLLGYMLLFWSTGALSWYESFRISGSSLLTLGFAV